MKPPKPFAMRVQKAREWIQAEKQNRYKELGRELSKSKAFPEKAAFFKRKRITPLQALEKLINDLYDALQDAVNR